MKLSCRRSERELGCTEDDGDDLKSSGSVGLRSRAGSKILALVADTTGLVTGCYDGVVPSAWTLLVLACWPAAMDVDGARVE